MFRLLLRVHVALVSVFLLPILGVADANDNSISAIKYDAESFDEEVPKNDHFVMFFAPWCGHCKRLAPTWDDLAAKHNDKSSDITIAKVDCTTDTALCSDHDVTGYPTLKLFKDGSTEGLKYRGNRDLASLQKFINEQRGKVVDTPEEDTTTETPVKEGAVLELTDETFWKHVEKGNHFIKFYAPWCGHCKKLAPTWEELGKTLEKDKEVTVTRLDCTLFREICAEFEVKGYPTLLWIVDGKKVEKYKGNRNHDDLLKFVSKMKGGVEDDVGTGGDAFELKTLVVELTGENFQNTISSGVSFVKFYAPWCGHCKKLAPTWEELALKFAENADVKVTKVDCTVDANRDLCQLEGVEGFPTLILYKNGEKLSEYDGDRTLDSLTGFVNRQIRDEL